MIIPRRTFKMGGKVLVRVKKQGSTIQDLSVIHNKENRVQGQLRKEQFSYSVLRRMKGS